MSQKTLSRRSFLKTSAAGVSAAGAATIFGATIAEAKPMLPRDVTRWDYTTDVVVMGYGAAGGNAAIGAADAGADVMLLEKSPEIGGNSATCLGAMYIPKNREEGFQYYKGLLFGSASDEMAQHCADELVALMPYLESLGIKVPRANTNANPTYPALMPEGFRMNSYRFNPTGFGGIQELIKVVNSRSKITVMMETPVTNLVQMPETGEIIGVKAMSGGRTIYIKARKGVVMACGGYENNKEMFKNFNIPGIENYLGFWGTPYNTGDGIYMAAGAGASMWHFPSVEWVGYTALDPIPALGCAPGIYYGNRAGSIMVNRFGKRFCREDRNTVHTKETLETFMFDEAKATYPNLPFYLVFDEEFCKTTPVHHPKAAMVRTTGGPCGYVMSRDVYDWSVDNSKEIERGWVIKGNTIKELADKINMPADALEETINNFNRYARNGNDEEFGRAPRNLRELKGPFYAVRSGVLYVNTQGGPERSVKEEVLDSEKKPIPRLYSAGEFGCTYGFLYQGGNNYPQAWISGNNAGKNAATNSSHNY